MPRPKKSLAPDPFDPSPKVVDLGLDPISRLNRDMRRAGATLTDTQARFLVDSYYIMQEDRKRSANQERALEAAGEPNEIIQHFVNQSEVIENQIKSVLDVYTQAHPMGSWMRQIYGIGPVLSAGFLAFIYMGEWCRVCHSHTKGSCDLWQASKPPRGEPPRVKHIFQPVFSTPTVGHIWSYAGIAGHTQDPLQRQAVYRVTFRDEIDPISPPPFILASGIAATPYYPDGPSSYIYQAQCGTAEAPPWATSPNIEEVTVGYRNSGQKPWERGKKRPWNATLKVVCWRFGDVLVKFSNNPECYYGNVYRTRKEYEIANNESGALAHIAAEKLVRDLERQKNGQQPAEINYHREGKLSPGHLDLRARRYAVKLFLAHLHDEWYRFIHNGKAPPLPYPIAHLGHSHIIKSPYSREA